LKNKEGKRIIAAKVVETIIKVSNLNTEQQKQIGHNNYIGIKGYRILGVGYSDYAESSYPKDQQELPFHFVGLVVLRSSKTNIQSVIQQFYEAGIQVRN
jgi:Ca2+-transporting ATPase